MTLCWMPLRGKRAVVYQWQKKEPGDPMFAQLAAELGDACNWGLRLDDLVVIDCDSPEAVKKWAGLCRLEGLEPSPYRLQGRPGRCSYWYRRPTGFDVRAGDMAGDMELKHGPGHQMAVPPSIHPDTGEPYHWLDPEHALEPFSEEPPDDMPEAPADLVDRERGAHQEGDAAAQVDWIGEGRRNEFLTSVGGFLLEHWGLHETALGRALYGVNRMVCRPPVDEAEVRKIAHSVSLYRPGEEIGWQD